MSNCSNPQMPFFFIESFVSPMWLLSLTHMVLTLFCPLAETLGTI